MFGTQLCELVPARRLREIAGKSQREIAQLAGLSRSAIVAVEGRSRVASLATLGAVAHALERRAEVVFASDTTSPDCSTVAVSYQVLRDGEDSWKVHLMDLVDELRRTGDARLITLPPPAFARARLTALIASTVMSLCHELGIDTPPWAVRSHYLDDPWFVAESEALKASAIAESPLAFRRNNIFVLDNFLARA